MADADCGNTNDNLMIYRSAEEALADAWASIDGKSDEFRSGRDRQDDMSRYSAYCHEAGEMIERLAKRGFQVVPTNVLSDPRPSHLRLV